VDGLAAVQPDEAQAGGKRGGPVRRRVVADVRGVARRDAQRVEGHVQDARVRLGEAAALRGDDDLEQRGEAGGREPRPLHAVDAVRDDAEPVVPAQAGQQRTAAGQAVPARGELVEVALAEAARSPRVAADRQQQAPEAFARERRLRRLAAPEGGPQLGVDALVGGDGRGRARQAEPEEGLPEGRSLGLVEIEKRVVDVEEDGAEAVQAVTWRGR
jgi:hypothetical protein